MMGAEDVREKNCGGDFPRLMELLGDMESLSLLFDAAFTRCMLWCDDDVEKDFISCLFLV